MNEESARDRFLEAENEASGLIDALKDLRAEINQYKDVRESLDDSIESAREAAKALTPISKGMQKLLKTLGDLGITEFREDLTATRDSMNTLSDTQVALKKQVETQSKQQNKRHLELKKQVETVMEKQFRHQITLLVLLALSILSVLMTR